MEFNVKLSTGQCIKYAPFLLFVKLCTVLINRMQWFVERLDLTVNGRLTVASLPYFDKTFYINTHIFVYILVAGGLLQNK